MSHPVADVTPINECVACGSKHLKRVMDLGAQPLANSFRLPGDPELDTYPLAVNRCENCDHIQLTYSVNPELMFKNYLYVSGTARTMHEHFDNFANWVDTEFNNTYRTGKTVLDIGCNDGTQLDYFRRLGYDTYGIDPAENLVSIAKNNHTIWTDFFNEKSAEMIASNVKSFDVITAQNVFAHGPDPLSFLLAAKKIMGPDTILFIQTSQADMIVNGEFDTIYHEHISFFNTLSMYKLCERAGLYLFRVEKTSIHGNSYIFCISGVQRSGNVAEQLVKEFDAGLYRKETYDTFAAKGPRIVEELIAEVAQYTRSDLGWLAVGYGAPAKGMTLLNYSSLKLDFIIDDNPLKQGRLTPGSNIPIYPASKLDEYEGAICFVPLAWNFFDEIVDKIKRQRNNKHDRFIRYFPKVESVS